MTMTVVHVHVSSGIDHLVPLLAETLGAGFDVQAGSAAGSDISVVSAQGAPAMSFLRELHPSVSFVVVRHGRMAHSEPNVAYFDAGADVFIASLSVTEIAAYIVAVARRAEWSARRAM